ncbi:MAG: lysylphosphatidylglycerol synthase transmembrane domain-containing protein [Planctomycetota bacterium]
MPDGKAKKTKKIFTFIRIAVVVVLITWGAVWLNREVGWDNLAETFLKINLGVFAVALGIFAIGQAIVALRWWLLLRSQSIFIKFSASVRLHFLGLFYNNFLPSSVGGDVVRAWYVTRHTDKRFEAALSVFVDRAIGLLSTMIIAAFFYMFFLRGRHDITVSGDEKQGSFLNSVAEYKWALIAACALLVAVFFSLLLHARGRVLLNKAWMYFRKLGSSGIKKLKDAIVIYCSKPLTILVVFGLTVFLQILTITGFWFLGLNLGIEASIKYYYVFFTLTWVLGAVPVSIGGAVVVEGTLSYMFIHFANVGKGAASALALCQRAVWMLTSLAGAVIHLFGAHLPEACKRDKMSSGTP